MDLYTHIYTVGPQFLKLSSFSATHHSRRDILGELAFSDYRGLDQIAGRSLLVAGLMSKERREVVLIEEQNEDQGNAGCWIPVEEEPKGESRDEIR